MTAQISITPEQKNQLIFNATFRQLRVISEATELLEATLAESVDLEALASNLHFHGFISASAAVRLSSGKEWIDVTITPEQFDKYANPARRFASKAGE